jgi:GNAT superfamily N-acetyltransferase
VRQEYGRYGNPTVAVAEQKLAALEGAEDAALFPSGMNALTTLLLAMLLPDVERLAELVRGRCKLLVLDLRIRALEPDLHNQGFGAAVMNAIIAEAATAGATLRLSVLRESNANRFYQRHGFSETHSEAYDIYYERAPNS